MKFVWLVRIIAFLMIIGTVGSVEIDRKEIKNDAD